MVDRIFTDAEVLALGDTYDMGEVWPQTTDDEKTKAAANTEGVIRAYPWRVSPYADTPEGESIRNDLKYPLARLIRVTAENDGYVREADEAIFAGRVGKFMERRMASFSSNTPSSATPSTPGGGVDRAAVESIIEEDVEPWARDDTTPIPADKLGNAPGGGGGDDAYAWATEGNDDPIPEDKLANQGPNPETWAEKDNADLIPADKLTHATDAIPSVARFAIIPHDGSRIPDGLLNDDVTRDAEVENFAKTANPNTRLPATKLPASPPPGWGTGSGGGGPDAGVGQMVLRAECTGTNPVARQWAAYNAPERTFGNVPVSPVRNFRYNDNSSYYIKFFRGDGYIGDVLIGDRFFHDHNRYQGVAGNAANTGDNDPLVINNPGSNTRVVIWYGRTAEGQPLFCVDQTFLFGGANGFAAYIYEFPPVVSSAGINRDTAEAIATSTVNDEVESWARDGNNDRIPLNKLPENIPTSDLTSISHWASNVTYGIDRITFFGGEIYRSIINNNTNRRLPDHPSAWEALGHSKGLYNAVVDYRPYDTVISATNKFYFNISGRTLVNVDPDADDGTRWHEVTGGSGGDDAYAWATEGNNDPIPAGKLGNARDSRLPAANADDTILQWDVSLGRWEPRSTTDIRNSIAALNAEGARNLFETWAQAGNATKIPNSKMEEPIPVLNGSADAEKILAANKNGDAYELIDAPSGGTTPTGDAFVGFNEVHSQNYNVPADGDAVLTTWTIPTDNKVYVFLFDDGGGRTFPIFASSATLRALTATNTGGKIWAQGGAFEDFGFRVTGSGGIAGVVYYLARTSSNRLLVSVHSNPGRSPIAGISRNINPLKIFEQEVTGVAIGTPQTHNLDLDITGQSAFSLPTNYREYPVLHVQYSSNAGFVGHASFLTGYLSRISSSSTLRLGGGDRAGWNFTTRTLRVIDSGDRFIYGVLA